MEYRRRRLDDPMQKEWVRTFLVWEHRMDVQTVWVLTHCCLVHSRRASETMKCRLGSWSRLRMHQNLNHRKS